jgi:hypothetical protein
MYQEIHWAKVKDKNPEEACQQWSKKQVLA